jgi:hypothetical protein
LFRGSEVNGVINTEASFNSWSIIAIAGIQGVELRLATHGT